MRTLKVYKGKINKRNVSALSKKRALQGSFLDYEGKPIDSQHLLISMLLPSAVKEFLKELEEEVGMLCGQRYKQGANNYRWSEQSGSIILGGQKVRIVKPRVRNKETQIEVPLEFYKRFQDPKLFEQAVFDEGLRKVSQRDYKKGVSKIASSFGFTKSSVSRKWIKATEKKLKEFNERDIEKLNIMGVLIDGKRFRKLGVVIAMGISQEGKKYVLGIYQCNTEHSEACKNLLEGLEKRGLPEKELLFVVDGGSGLNKALEDKYDVHLPGHRRAVRVRCYHHKWMNLERILNEEHQGEASALFWGMRDAKTSDVACECSRALESFLGRVNPSALKSYQSAKEDLLIIHSLRLSPLAKKFFSTTNAIESLNYLLEEDLRRVKRWSDANHFQRWLATCCLENEKRMRRVRGYR